MTAVTTKFYGHTYTLNAPFEEGHKLTAAEAEALSRYWGEQVMNLVRGKVDKETPPDEVKKIIDEVSANYQFGRRRGGSTDPVTVRARELAMAVAKTRPEVREALEEIDVDLKSKVAVAEGIKQISEELWDKIVATAEKQIEEASSLL